MNERRKKGLCYFCDEPFTYEHSLTHKKLQLHMVEIDKEEDDETLQFETMVKEIDFGDPYISVNALTGVQGFRTMRVTGSYKKKPLHILIDSGSTHNFLDVDIAKKLGCRIQVMKPLQIIVADGNKMKIEAIVKEFSWFLQHNKFQADMMLIPLGCCDMVLGIEWLVTLGDIVWNFDKLKMEFVVDGKRHVLRGSSQNGIKIIKNQLMEKTLMNGVHLSMIQVYPDEGPFLQSLTTHAQQTTTPTAISALLAKFEDVFEEPTQLPPMREAFNHKIPLLQCVNPVNKRPYRYVGNQKDIIDKLVQDMLNYGFIQSSCSHYASPVVPVGKKDGSWQLCVDYRELNKGTVKDRFPIPLVKDLMDELNGVMFFSKIDLRSGYHQVKIDPTDVHKTAFKTHSGHYEYVVMPFGLTNAPATFQSLMNAIFSKFLRKFVLVFFL
uniref:Transposon Ty3-I Gag-Pol polyprotein n=1 Tax=Cajanus cajan TaxID=3821 RepID=A0A151SX41_CAJCA|nr:Transposon Ty3-I Gag-Pol polyprotein [Cajanus cajan]